MPCQSLIVNRKVYSRAPLKSDGGGEPLTMTGGVWYVGLFGETVAGGGRTVGLLLEHVGPG